jgi:hypothetical protein
MHGLACGEGNGWFEGGADSYTCKNCFDKSGISFTPISAYYAKSISPRDPTLLQDLLLHQPKLMSVKGHKKKNGTTNLDASNKESVAFYSKYKKYLDDALILDVAVDTTQRVNPRRLAMWLLLLQMVSPALAKTTRLARARIRPPPNFPPY